MFDDTEINESYEKYICFVLLGGTMALFVHYGSLLHAPNSKDVVEAVFAADTKTCYKLVPYVVPC
jgi:hypothetical protein